MNQDALRLRLRALLSAAIQIPEEQIGPDAAPGRTPGWDSVANLAFIAALEDEYGVAFTARDAMRLRSFAEIASFVAENRVLHG